MFSIEKQRYATDKYEYRNGVWHWNGTECKGADAASFLPRNNVWATDRHGLFKQDKRLRSTDAQSCKILNLLFAKDSHHVFYIEGIAKAVIDVATFEVLDAGEYAQPDGHYRRFGYARDRQNIYTHDFFSGSPKLLKGADPNTFERLTYGFAKDAKHVWVEGERIAGAVAKSLEAINDLYSKDRGAVYYWESRLSDADPASFRSIGKMTGADERHVYLQRDIIADADPKTYEEDRANPCNGRDAKNNYESGKIVANGSFDLA